MLDSAPTAARRWGQAALHALVLGAVSLLVVVILWLCVAWLVRRLSGDDYGPRSPVGVWIAGTAVALCAAYAVVSSLRWARGWRDPRPLLRADIDDAHVVEEHYVFVEAKRFQEPEHGGLMYFLRTADDKVFTLFDHESQDLGVQQGDPLKSSFEPKSDLVMVRSPRTQFVISQRFSGTPLNAGDPIALGAGPDEWPETESYCNLQWAELEAKLGAAVTRPAA